MANAEVAGTLSGSVAEDTSFEAHGAVYVTGGLSGGSFLAGEYAGIYGTLTVLDTGDWRYLLDNGLVAVQSLARNTEAYDNFAVLWGNGSVQGQIDITVQGVNDVATVGGDLSRTLALASASSVSGQLEIADTDNGEKEFVAATRAGVFGTLTLAKSGAWEYTLLPGQQTAIQDEAKNVTDTFSVSSADGTPVGISVQITPLRDTTAPTISTLSPTDEATGVAIGSNIVVTFSEAIARGTGNILLKNASGTTIATYDVATSNNLAISGSTLTINPSTDLANSTAYRVEFAAGSVKDIAGNSFAGTTTYNFTTVAPGNFIPTTINEVETRFSEPHAPRKNYFFLSMQAQANDLTAHFSTVDSGNSALAGQDYISANTTVTIPAGTTSFAFGIDILSNNYAESEESFSCTVVLDIANQPSIELVATHTIEAHASW